MSLFLISLVVCAFGVGLLLGRRRSWQKQRSSDDLQPSREQILSWLDQAPLGWLILDQKNRVRFINARAQRMLQIPASETPPYFIGKLAAITSLLDLIEHVRDHNHHMRQEWDFEGQKLEVFAFSGQQESVALLLQSRRSLEAQLNQQERWVSDVAHELKTPLTALLLVGDSLAANVNDQNAVLVERLLRELRRMQDLVGDLLELSRLENALPGIGISHEGIPMQTLITEVWQGVKPLADDKHIHCELTTTEPVLPLVVVGDRRRLHRALLNLFDNALRYSPEGGKITIDLHASADWLRVGIRDQGPGLSEQDLEHMFERFYRGDASRFRHQRGGSGLGLAIVQQIVLTHGGWVLGENDPSGGARFEIRLPRKLQDGDACLRAD
jgi:two-component system phosphate regulon sensor histidine kinase PhoR